MFSQLQNMVLVIFLYYYDPSYFQTSKLSYFLFILNDLKCYKAPTEVLQIIFEL
jgi:hypothetical protein